MARRWFRRKCPQIIAAAPLDEIGRTVIHFTPAPTFRAYGESTTPSGQGAVNGNLGVLAYAACGFLIVVYAWGRSNVPPANLRLVLLVYLALGGPLFAHAASGAYQQGGRLMVAGKIAHVQLVTIGMAVWLMQRRASFNRKPGDPPRFSPGGGRNIDGQTDACNRRHQSLPCRPIGHT